ncbi:MAG: D-alanyl-D-alanine carboxypeptidase family protein, partial [Usitatibacter sp.]
RAPSALRQPASLAKLAAALVVLEAAAARHGLLDGAVVVSASAARAPRTRLGLNAGERVRAADLLAGMVIGSANDACYALAEYVAGSRQAFVRRMNRLARRLSMGATRFGDACGFDEPRQRTTAADLLLLADAALASEALALLARTNRHRFTTLGEAREIEVRSTNPLLDSYPGVVGLKTGFTVGAGPCLILVAREGVTTVTVVLLDAPDRWPLGVSLLDWSFDLASGVRRPLERSARLLEYSP